jgi:uncharacterized protein DUF1236
MRHDHLPACAVLVSLLAGVSLAVAQQAPPPAEPQQQIQQEKAQRTPSGQMGKEEPSSHAPVAKPEDGAALVNGALAVPGAPTDTDTVPAKYSERNAASDKLITVAYTFRSLTPEQRLALYQGLKDQPPGKSFNASIGTELPLAIELRAVPDEVAARVPQAKGYQYVVAGSEVLLVSPPTRIVVGQFLDAH